jgi:hypothetical protein
MVESVKIAVWDQSVAGRALERQRIPGDRAPEFR